jgi:glyoxylase-like metal-dependent hydrolase (beta-lactamase superfamily II)
VRTVRAEGVALQSEIAGCPARGLIERPDEVLKMIFRQLFDQVSGTYSYLLASRRGGEALIIDPVLEKVERYLQLVRELDLKLVKAVDTHLHADHITGLGALRDKTHCITVMGEQTKADVVSMRLGDGDKLTIEGLALDVIYTPGHTDAS